MLEKRPPALVLVGRRGAGKSSLVNALFGAKVAELGHVTAQTGRGRWYEYERDGGVDVDPRHARRAGGVAARRGRTTAAARSTRSRSSCARRRPTSSSSSRRRARSTPPIDADIDVLERVYKEVKRAHRTEPPLVAVVTHCDLFEPKGTRLHRAAEEPRGATSRRSSGTSPRPSGPSRRRSTTAPALRDRHVATHRRLDVHVVARRRRRCAPTSAGGSTTSPSVLFRHLPDASRAELARATGARAVQEELATTLTRGDRRGVRGHRRGADSRSPTSSRSPRCRRGSSRRSPGSRAARSTSAARRSSSRASARTWASAFALREAVRAIVKVIAPGGGSVVSATIAFSGTLAIGAAARAYYIRGLSLERRPEGVSQGTARTARPRRTRPRDRDRARREAPPAESHESPARDAQIAIARTELTASSARHVVRGDRPRGPDVGPARRRVLMSRSDAGPRRTRLSRARFRPALRPVAGRAALVRVLGAARRLRGERRAGRHAARRTSCPMPPPTSRAAAHGARAQRRRSRTCSSAGTACAATTRSGSRGSTTPASPRRPWSSAARARGQDAPRPRPRGVRRARVAVEGARAAAASHLQQRVLGASPDWSRAQVHDGRGHEPRRHRGVRAPLRAGPHVPRHAPHQLVPRVHDGAQRPRGRERRGRQRRALRVRVPGRRRGRRDRRRDHAPRDDARRHRRRRAPGRPALHGAPRQARAAPLRRPHDPHRHRRDPRRPEVRHRRREGDAGARLQRLRDRQAARPRGDQHPQPRRHAERQRRARSPGMDRKEARTRREEGARREGPRARRQAARAHAPALPALGRRRRADDLDAVVPQDEGDGREARSRPCARARPSIIPGEWEKTYDHFLENIQDWCVSRQLWWGHQIPAWHGPERRDHGRARAPAECTAADGVDAGPRRARHLVLERALAVLHARLARGDRRAARSSIPRAISRRATTSSSSGSRA